MHSADVKIKDVVIHFGTGDGMVAVQCCSSDCVCVSPFLSSDEVRQWKRAREEQQEQTERWKRQQTNEQEDERRQHQYARVGMRC